MADQRAIGNPFLRGQYAAQASNQQADQAQLQGLATLLKLKQAQEEQPVRMDLLRAQTEDARAKPEDRALARGNTREMALARIGEQARRTDMEYELKIRSAADKNEAAQWERARDQARLTANETALRMTGERLYYDTGTRVNVPSLSPTLPGGSPGAPAASVAPPSGPPFAPAPPRGLESLLNPQAVSSSVNAMFPPAAQAAAAAEGADIQRREVMPNGGGMLETAQVFPQLAGRVPSAGPRMPVPVAPGGPAMPGPAVPNSGNTPINAAPVSAPIPGNTAPAVATPPQMPAFQSPRAREQWLAGQAGQQKDAVGAPFEVTGPNGLPQLVVQHKRTGQILDANTLQPLAGSVGPKIGETAQKQQTGVQTTKDAIIEYRDALKSFSAADLVNPSARARMGTVYNNMLLQAKEAYNLGVLNGPDYMILQEVITNPASFTGAITSKQALDDQAAKLDSIMSRIGARVTQTQSGVAGATQPPQRRSTDGNKRMKFDAQGNLVQ